MPVNIASRSGRASRLLRSLDPLSLAGILLLIILWHCLSLIVSPSLLSSPTTAVAALADGFFEAKGFAYYGLEDVGFFSALSYTLQNVALATTFGSAFGILAGLLSARSGTIRSLLDPVVFTLGTTPIIVASPFLLIWVGGERASAVTMVCFYVFVTLYIYTLRAVTNIDPVYESFGMSVGAHPGLITRSILLPAIVPEILGGIRIAFASSWGLECLAELLGSQRGLGKLIESITNASDTDNLFAALLLLGLAALFCDRLLTFVIRLATPWNNAGQRIGF